MSDVVMTARRRATRERLLEAATEVFAEDGLLGASVEAICARAGFTRGAFYSNFETKEQLFLALLEREFDRRARHLEETAAQLGPVLREAAGQLDPERAAEYIAEFFAPEGDAASWFALETEFLLLAIRDPAIAPEYQELTDGFIAGITGVVEGILGAAGRRFVLPAELAVATLIGEYERARRAMAIRRNHSAGGFADLAARMSELLFVITSPSSE